MNAVLDATGALIALGETDSFVAPTGGRVIKTDLTHDVVAQAQATATGTYDLVLDTAKATHRIVVRARAKVAAELDEDDRADLKTRLRAALDGWGTLTAADKDALLKLCVRAALRTVR